VVELTTEQVKTASKMEELSIMKQLPLIVWRLDKEIVIPDWKGMYELTKSMM
jgi:hypothetical protein